MTIFLFVAGWFFVLAILAAIADHSDEWGRKLGDFCFRPEPTTERPVREEPVDFAAALRTVGPLPRWTETRKES